MNMSKDNIKAYHFHWQCDNSFYLLDYLFIRIVSEPDRVWTRMMLHTS